MSKCRLADLFDLVGGTSTGGMLALMIVIEKENNVKSV